MLPSKVTSLHIPGFARVLSLVGGCLLLAGCGKENTSVYDVSGTVTFNGRPVPSGRIYFNPDFTRNNDGPQGFADIKHGTFDTRQGGRKVISGPVIARVEGFDGPEGNPRAVGNPLFLPYEIKLDLPKEASVQALEVPASAAVGLPPPRKGPGP
jgi:hypothetical protein